MANIITPEPKPVMDRFTHLLQPIRELADNWNIDIAHDLEDYLTELEGLIFSFDGGKTNLNFSEAALLIQGSACIYSKKVEYLYGLVHHTLELIEDKRKERQKTSLDEQGRDADAEFVEDPDALSLDMLDDRMTTSDNIDLDDSQPLSRTTTVIRTPITLMRSEEDSSDNKRLRDYRVSSAFVHASGALLLDVTHADSLDLTLSMRDPQHTTQTINLPPLASPSAGAQQQVDTGNDSDDEDEADHMDTGGFVPGADYDDIPAMPGMDDNAEQGMRPVGRGGRTVTRVKKNDPWATLDPHSTEGAVVKPFAKGKISKVRTSKPKLENGSLPSLDSLLSCLLDVSVSQAFLNRPYFQEGRKRFNAQRPKKPKQTESVQVGDDEYEAASDVSDNEQADWQDVAGFAPGDEYDDIPAMPGMDDNSGPDVPTSQADTSISYEKLCQQYLDDASLKVQQYFQESALTSRVAEWQSKIEPKLQEQEQRPAFDIQEYGAVVLDKLPAKKVLAADFSHVVKGEEQYNVSRMFAAILQLANSGNVFIVQREKSDDFGIKMLNKQIRGVDGLTQLG